MAAVLGVGGGYRPLSDDGILLVRARDVGSVHTPLLGSATSASTVLDRGLNNAGPLYFDLVALPVKVFGPWIGLVVGVALVNVAVTTLALVFRAAGCGHGRAGRGGRRRRCAAVGHARGAAVRRLAASSARAALLRLPRPRPRRWRTATCPRPLGGRRSAVCSSNAHELRAPRGRADLLVGVAAWARRRWAATRPGAWSLLVNGAVVAVAWAQPLIDQVAGRGNLGGIAGRGSSTTKLRSGVGHRGAHRRRGAHRTMVLRSRMGVPCRSPDGRADPGLMPLLRRAPCCWRWWAGWQHSPLSADVGPFRPRDLRPARRSRDHRRSARPRRLAVTGRHVGAPDAVGLVLAAMATFSVTRSSWLGAPHGRVWRSMPCLDWCRGGCGTRVGGARRVARSRLRRPRPDGHVRGPRRRPRARRRARRRPRRGRARRRATLVLR